MKRLVPFALAGAFVLSTTGPVAAQGFGVGVKAGATVSKLAGDIPDESVTNKAGFGVGAYATLGIAPMFAIQPEVMFVQKGTTSEVTEMGSVIESDLSLSYVEVPVLARLSVPTPGPLSPFLVAGPAVAFESGCTLSVEGLEGDIECDDPDTDTFARKSTDFGVIVGGGTAFGLGPARLDVDARYNIGLTSIDDSGGEADVKNRSFSVTVGVAVGTG